MTRSPGLTSRYSLHCAAWSLINTRRWHLFDKCQLRLTGLMSRCSLILEWAGSGCWPRDSDQQLPHLAVIKDAETRVWDQECKVRSLITRGDIAGLTLHLTLVMTNSLRVNQAQSPEFLVILGFCNQRAEGSAQWASLGVEMDKSPGGHFLDILCCKKMFLRQI